MSDVSGIKINDVLGLSDPITKLIETVSNGVGKLYEPIHINRMAKAKTNEIALLSDAINNAKLLPIEYNDGSVVIDGTDYTELAQRAQGRLAFQEIKKQNNIDRVVGVAARRLLSCRQISEEPVDVDWVTRFFDSVADVSTEDMQIIWGRILAGEVKSPGSFSLRTLEAVKNLSRKEAEIFSKLASIVVFYKNTSFVTSNNELLNKYGISYMEIMILDECGLINSSGTLTLNNNVSNNDKFEIYNDNRLSFIKGKEREEYNVSIGLHTLTNVGQELYGIVEHEPNNEYFIDFMEEIEKINKGKVLINVHAINEIKDNTINYKDQPLQIIEGE